eukprot:TRINITY_DN13961_c0_g1_i1.p1 TRINITY_DN13961_c0_g1~~TRINITY_DN13961_c0_g1_i1.p1  ORF type:complete len:1005 (+),score=152.39 TRINITY_DN13961_c0_g1_i1:181-3195(+)
MNTSRDAAMRAKLLQDQHMTPRGVVRDGKKPRQSLIPRVPAMDPVNWNKEVVRALATRLPGGRSQVTTECKICNSVFYPCLCPGEDTLVAPKVVMAAERRRIAKCNMGHLDEMQKVLDLRGMDKETIHVMGPAAYNDNRSGLNSAEPTKCRSGKTTTIQEKCWTDFAESGLGSCARKVLWREGDVYVLSAPEKISQKISLTHEELLKLSQAVVQTNGKLIIDPKPGSEPIKLVEVLYYLQDEADGDLKLQPVKEIEDMAADGDGSRPCWEVKSLKGTDQHGLASNKDICVGQRLLSFSYDKLLGEEGARALSIEGREALARADNQKLWASLDLDAGQRPWSCFSPADRPSQWEEDEGHFPCKLVFDQLIPRSCLQTAREPGHSGDGGWRPFTKDVMEELLVNEKGAELQIAWQKQERIDRNEYQIRHQHWTEKNEELGRQKTNITQEGMATQGTTENNNGSPPDDGGYDAQKETELDLKLYRAWVGKHRMTPRHLSFVFAKLESAIQKEMAAFNEKKTSRLKTLLCKSISAAALSEEIESLRSAQEQGDKKTSKEERQWLKHLETERSSCIEELHIVFSNVPLFFLSNDVLNLADVKAAPDRRNAGLLRNLTRRSNKAPMTPRPPKSPQPGKQAKRRTITRRDASVAAGKAMATARDDSDEHQQLDSEYGKGVKLLKDETRKYLNDQKGKGRDNPITADCDAAESEDGRLNPKEFGKTLIMSGMHWLATNESNALFDAMDTDKSGKLTLGELLNCATRMARLVQSMQAYQQEQIQAGRILGTEQLIQEFDTVLELGEDLVGTRDRPVVPDSSITASSYFLDQSNYGKGEMWRSRLDCLETCWVGKTKEHERKQNNTEHEEPWWIQWEFSHLRTVTTVVTMGRPDAECWVTAFKIRYSCLTSESKKDDWQYYHHGTQMEADEEVNSDEEENEGQFTIFKGNTDRNSRKVNILRKPIGAARRVRLYITQCRSHGDNCEHVRPALRASLYGKFHESASCTRVKRGNI